MQPDIGEHDTSHISDDTDHVHNNARASQQHRIITATMHHRTLQSEKKRHSFKRSQTKSKPALLAQRPHQHCMSNYHTAHLFFTHSDIHKCGHFSSCVVVILPAGHQQAGCKPRPSSRRVRCCCAFASKCDGFLHRWAVDKVIPMASEVREERVVLRPLGVGIGCKILGQGRVSLDGGVQRLELGEGL